MEVETISQVEFKKALGNYPTGVTVITTFDRNNKPVGLTANSFASVSIDPLLILWSLDKNSSLYDPFIQTSKFAINILADDQENLCTLFASKVPDRFGQCVWEESAQQLPVFPGALSQLECEVYNKIDAGDHIIFIGKVIHITNEDKNPLLYHKRNFGAIPEEFYKKVAHVPV